MKQMKLFLLLAVVIGLLGFDWELTANVIKVKASVNPPEYSGTCPKRFEFIGVIAVDKPCVVKYKWIRSDNAISPDESISFRQRGTQRISSYWELGAAGEHWQAVEILAPNPMVSNKAVFKLKCMTLAVIKPEMRVRADLVRPQVDCIDPAAFEIRFEIVRRDSQFRGRIRITGVVKNIGNKAFQSGPNQAAAYLYQLPAGVPPASATGGTIVAQQPITNLAVGATLNLSWERDWDSSSPNEGEFPNSYRLLISYDPDIYMDANKDNDDCNQNNNKKERNGSEINDMLK
jgi:hypothetical protein